MINTLLGKVFGTRNEREVKRVMPRVQAINALNRVDVFFIPDKGTEKEDLARLRREICEQYIRDRTYRLVGFETPARSMDDSDYKLSVRDWHSRIEQDYEKLLMEELGEGKCGRSPGRPPA